MGYGVIYVAHNPRDGNTVFKVGKTERSAAERMVELSADTSNLGTYQALAYFVVTDIDTAETACHQRLSRYRVQRNREFFDLPLARLLRIVREETLRFKANDFVPTIEHEEVPPQLAPAEKLRAARAQQKAREAAWEAALRDSKVTAKKWSEEIRDRAKRAARELSDVDIAQWDISECFETEKKPVPLCKVTVYAKFRSQPVLLDFRGLSGKRYGSLDLSHAVGEPKVTGVISGSSFVEWQEPDDGRVGEVLITIHVDHMGPQHPERVPIPKLCVQANRLRYDDYKCSFKAYSAERNYSDPYEAFEVFLDTVVANVRDVQYDIRSETGTYKGRRKIRDASKFKMGALKND